MIHTVLSVSFALWLVTQTFPPGADAATVIAGIVRTQSGQPLSGLVLLEKGEIHNNRWDRGTLVDATGRAFAMAPPRWVWTLKSNYPDGVYQLEVDTSKALTDPRDWHFVVADHKCNTTDVLSFPHEPKPPRVIR